MCIFSNVVRIQKVCPILPWKIYSPIVFIIGCCQHIAKYDLMYFFCPWCRIHDWNQNKPRENLIPCLFFHQKEAFLLGQEQRNDTKIQNTNFGLFFMEVLWIRQHCRLSICEYWLSWTNIRIKDPNNHSDTETGTLSTVNFYIKYLFVCLLVGLQWFCLLSSISSSKTHLTCATCIPITKLFFSDLHICVWEI